MYKLVIIWANGEKIVHFYETREKAEKVEFGFITAFGNQIEWTTVYKV